MSVLRELKIKDLVTLSGTFCGITSIILSLEGNLHPILPAIFIIFALFMDTMDGFIARKLNQINELGKELDSLSDTICFGVAPAILIYGAYTSDGQLIFTGISGLLSFTLLIPCALFIFAAVVRLAWFNIDESEGYTGLTTPLSAGFLVALLYFDFFYFLYTGNNIVSSVMIYLIPIIMCILAYLNVTPYLVYGKNIRKKTGVVKKLFSLIAFLFFCAWIMSFFYQVTSIFIVLIVLFVLVLEILNIFYGFLNYIKIKKNKDD
ncbi:MAG: CDP-alcohol phosphatidyltransferase family protein [Promethearchaeota archaeon]